MTDHDRQKMKLSERSVIELKIWRQCWRTSEKVLNRDVSWYLRTRSDYNMTANLHSDMLHLRKAECVSRVVLIA